MTLRVRNFAIEYRTPADVDPAHSRDILDRTLTAVRRDLPNLLRRALAGETNTEGVVVIERLDFEALISADWDADVIANEITRQLLRSLWTKMTGPETSRFQDDADLLAQFLLDLADGFAFMRPWHQRFDGLKALPVAAIVRTLIERDPAAALAGMARLSQANAHRILSQMSATEARRGLSAILFAAESPCRDIRHIARALTALDPAAIRIPGAGAADEPLRRIAFATALFRQAAMHSDAITMRLADLLLAEANSSRNGAPPPFGQTENSDERSVAGLISGEDLEEALKILARAVTQHAAGQYARIAGYWLLAQHIVEQTRTPPLVLAALALTAGPNAPEVWRDSVLRNALDLPPDDGEIIASLPANLEKAVDRAPPRPLAVRRRDLAHLNAAAAVLAIPKSRLRLPMRLAAHAMRRYANRLPGFSESSFAHLWSNLLSAPGKVYADAKGVFIALSPPPLDVVWRISGAGAADYRLPNGRRVIIEVRR